MAARPQRRSRSVTAAGVRLTGNNDAGTSTSPKRTEDQWKKEAWHAFHSVGEVKFATRFRANSLARLRLYPAIRVDDEDDPISVQAAAALTGDGESEDAPVALLSEAEADAIVEEWQRLRHTVGGMAELQRSYGVHMTIPGETNLIGWDDNGTERWAMLPETCVAETDKPGIYKIKHPDTGAEFTIDASETGPDFAARLWIRDESMPWKSDSNLRSALDIVEELLIYQRSLRATGKSRNSAGIVALANDFDFESDPVEEIDDEDPDNVVVLNPDESEDHLTPFERGILRTFIAPTEDDGSAASVAPHIIRGPLAAIKDGIKHLSLARDIDPEVLKRIDHLIERLAHALDVPVEVITGIADANHWTAWFIEDTTYKAHIEPLAQMLCDDLARVFLRPALLARGINPDLVDQIVLWVDPSGLVVRPNRYQDALEAFKEYALSWDALRRYGNFGDSDAPKPEEIAARVEIAAGLHGRAAVEAPPGAEAPTPAQPDPPAPGGEGGDIAPGEESGGGNGGGTPTPATVLAAGGPNATDLGQRLAGIDQRLAARVQAAASAALTAALARAGARLRAAVQGDPSLATALRGVANSEVGTVIGPGHAPSADLISPADFDGLHEQWNDWTAQARSQAITAVTSEGERRGLDPDTIDSAVAELAATQAHDTESGWGVLVSALVDLGRNRIYTPDGTPDQGEFDPHLSVPMGVVRRALGTMGDGGLGDASGPSLTGGPASGLSMMRFGIGAALGASTVAYQWTWGGGANGFPPHEDLDGLVFSGPDDPGLLYDGWPADGGYLAPGDHDGCSCSLDPIIVFGGALISDDGDGEDTGD